jgi:hypothetical protein
MKRTGYGFIVAAIIAVTVPVFAQKPANAPANASAQCTDGTFSTAKTEKGACSKHGGVKTWFGASTATAKSATTREPTKSAPATKEATKAPAPPPRASATVPAGATGQCTDDTYTKAKTQNRACSQHGGVKTWFAGEAPATAPSVPAATPKNAPVATPKNVPPPVAPSTQKATPAAKPSASSGKAQIVAKPADAPPDATGKCKDGTYSSSKTHTGACSHHGGVAEWYR